MEIVIGIGLMVALVLAYVIPGLGEGGTTCLRCDRERDRLSCRACPLRTLGSDRTAPGDLGDPSRGE